MKTLFEALNTIGIYICAFLMTVMVVSNFANTTRFNSMDATIKVCQQDSRKAVEAVEIINNKLEFQYDPAEVKEVHFLTYKIRRNIYWNDQVYKERKRLSKLTDLSDEIIYQ
jgi:hypothetical protein